MKFELHTKLRWQDYPADRFKVLHDRARKRYYQHLSRLNFRKKSDLLKYFGDAFFHDAEIVSIVYDPRRNDLELRLLTMNDLEDINTHRRARGRQEISRSRYQRRPIFYLCRFRGVQALTKNTKMRGSIIDTELQRGRKPGEYRVVISFTKRVEVSFDCTECRVSIDSLETVRRLTGGLARIPRCGLCRSRLVTEKKLHQVVGSSRDG